jgi:hypothetical protein
MEKRRKPPSAVATFGSQTKMVVNDLRKPLKIPRLIYVAMFAISWTTVSMSGGTTITTTFFYFL